MRAVLVACALLTAGCLAPSEGVLLASAPGAALQVTGPDGPVPFAAVTAVGDLGPLAALATDANGTLDPALLPALTRRVVVAAPGLAPADVPVPLPATIALVVDPAPPAAGDLSPVLRFLPPLDLGGGALKGQHATCDRYNCGMSEPVLEVAGDGSIYVSATCCVGEAPPVWVSRDGGVTFEPMATLYREAIGIEGDFAVDDAGNVYFTDILAGAVWFTSWDPDGNERWTIPVPFPPLVDRPWVRAGAEDVVYFAYNTGFDTLFYRSIDGGLTWGGTPLYRAGAGLGDLGQGPENEHLYLVTDTPDGLRLHETRDGGDTWETEDVPVPDAPGGSWDRRVPVADEAGNLWVVYAWGDEDGTAVWASRRDADGAWADPIRVSPEGGAHVLAWPAALRDGTLAVAWYAAPWATVKDGDVGDGDAWYLMVAATVDDGASFQRVLADPEPVAEGPLGRRLLDFLQIDVAPDGALHVAYAADRYASPEEHTLHVRSTTGLQLQPAVFPYGPMGGHEHADVLDALR